MRDSKALKLLLYMEGKKDGLSYSEMQQFFYDLKYNNNKKRPNGYYCVAITKLGNNGMFRYKNKKYFISKLAKEGIKNKTLKPYAEFQSENQKIKHLNKVIRRFQKRNQELMSSNSNYKMYPYWQNTKEDNYRMKVGTLINRLMSLKDDDAYIDISSDPEGNSFGDIADFKYENYAIFEGKFKDGKKVYSLMPRDNEQPENRYHGWDSYEEGGE